MQDRFFIQQQLSIAEFYKASLYLGLRNKRLKKIYFMVLGLMCLLGLSNLFLLPKTDEKWYVTVLQVITPPLFPVIFLFAGTFILCVLMMVIKPNNFKNIIYEFT